MPPRATIETLLKLRRAEEQDAIRALATARRVADRADAVVAAARQARDRLSERLRASADAGATVGSTGALAASSGVVDPLAAGSKTLAVEGSGPSEDARGSKSRVPPGRTSGVSDGADVGVIGAAVPFVALSGGGAPSDGYGIVASGRQSATAAVRSGRRTVTALLRSEAWRDRLRQQLAEAKAALGRAEQARKLAANGVTAAQIRLEGALRAREAAERQLQLQVKSANRRQERKEQAAAEDNWRPRRR